MRRALDPAGDGVYAAQYRVRWPDGTVHWISAVGRTHFEEQDGTRCPKRMLGTVTDITREREAEEALRRTDQRKNEFIATLAHELRNPLSPIRNAAAILRAAPYDLTVQAKSVDIIERQVQHMAHLLDDLLDVARITNNQMNIQKQPVLLCKTIDDAVEAVQPLVHARAHRLTIAGADEPLEVMGDSVRLTQIFVNLLSNAAKYTSQRGLISITLAQEGGEAVVEVKDNGVGIAADQVSNLFQLFSRLASTSDIQEGGLGIGLSLVKLLVEAHGGTVRAFSAGLGQGSAFIVRLPLTHQAQAPQTTASPGEERRSPNKPRVVVVVDDNSDAADSLAMLLLMQGHKVYVAYDGIRAVELACSVSPDIVFLDLGLSGLNGIEVGRRIKAILQPTPPRIVAITGWGAAKDRLGTVQAGFDLHLTKPVGLDAINAALGQDS